MSVRGADGKFKSVGRKAKAPAAKKTKQTKKTTAKTGKRVATAKQLAALQRARMARTGMSLKKKYGSGGAYGLGFDGNFAYQGPAAGPTTAGNAISSIVDPEGPGTYGRTNVNAYDPEGPGAYATKN